MSIPEAIFETKTRLGQAMLTADDRDQRNLLASAKASIDWLIEHYDAMSRAYHLAKNERSRVS